MKETRKEGMKEGMYESRNEGMKESVYEGRNEGMKEGRNGGLYKPINEGMNKLMNELMNEGMNEGMKENTHLNLHWADHNLSFIHLLDTFRKQKLYCDVCLVCQGGAVYHVHKVVLSACSDFFAKMFESVPSTSPVLMLLQDVTKEELEALLTYVYCGQVQLPRPALKSFLEVASSLHVKGLSPPPLTPLDPDETHPCATTTTGVTPFQHHDHIPSPHSMPHIPDNRPPPPYHQLDPLQYHRPGVATPLGGDKRVAEDPDHLYQVGTGKTPSQRDPESQRPPRKRFSPHFPVHEASSGGTFQNLVTGEETPIKQEPQDITHDPDRFSIYEREKENGCEDEKAEKKEAAKEATKEEEEQMVVENRPLEGNDGCLGRLGDTEEMNGDKMRNGDGGIGEEEDGKGRLLGIFHESSTAMITDKTQEPSPRTVSSPSLPSPTIPSAPTAAPTPSQLRRELLKPLHLHPQPGRGTEVDGMGGVSVESMDHFSLTRLPNSPPTSSPHHFQLLPHHYPHHPHHAQHVPYLHHPRDSQNRRREPTTATSIITPITNAAIKTHHHHQHHQHHHHHQLTSQPTSRAHLVTPLPHAPHTPPQYPPPLMPFRGTSFIDTDAPLNLSQDHQHAYHPADLQNSATKKSREIQANRLKRDRDRDHDRDLSISRDQRHTDDREKDPILGKILTNRKRRMRGPKSWEYLVRLLKDPTTNPSLIRWENESNAVFRLVEPAAIAQRWGRRTGKHASECLTYENFARGLRYHYFTGALQPVSERSFVYKFGPKALSVLHDDMYGGSANDAPPGLTPSAPAHPTPSPPAAAAATTAACTYSAATASINDTTTTTTTTVEETTKQPSNMPKPV